MEFDISKATKSDQTNVVTDFTVPALSVDSTDGQKETEWQNAKWTQQWGYFNAIADLKSAILMKAIWIVGKGYKTDTATEVLLENITGWGKDTFDDIIFNMEVIKRVGGDAYCLQMRNDAGDLINLRPLDPGSIKHIVSPKGRLIRYEQTEKVGSETKVINKFKPEEIFHLCNNRLADQIHGISDIDVMEDIIKAEGENFKDMKTIMHRQARPLIMFKLGTDDQTEVSAFVRKMDEATRDGENIYIPDDKNTVTWEVVQVSVSSVIMEWRNDIRNKFYRTIGLPQVVPGAGGQSTESESKVIYLAFEQIIEKDQNYLEKQIWNQLALRLNFIPPATLSQQLKADEKKDGTQGLQGGGFQPSDTEVTPPVEPAVPEKQHNDNNKRKIISD